MGAALLTLFILGILGVAALVLLAFFIWWYWLRRVRVPEEEEEEPGRFEPDATVDIVRGEELGRALRESLAGSLARPADPTGEPPSAVVWTDLGDEVLVHLDSLVVDVGPGAVTASLVLESDQTGRQTMRVPFAVGESRDDASLIAVTEELPSGHPGLAARWGRSVQAALWNGVLDLARSRAGVADGVPGRIWVEGDEILFEASTPPPATTTSATPAGSATSPRSPVSGAPSSRGVPRGRSS